MKISLTNYSTGGGGGTEPSLVALDGQPLYIKDKARLYIGNDLFQDRDRDKDLFMPVVAPYKHIVKLSLQGRSDSRAGSADFENKQYTLDYASYGLIKYLRIEAILTFTSFRKEPIPTITYNNSQSNDFYTALKTLGDEKELTDKMFPVSISGIAHSGVVIGQSGTPGGPYNFREWQGVVGPIIGFEPGKKILMSYMAKYNVPYPEGQGDSFQPPSNLVGRLLNGGEGTASYSLDLIEFIYSTPNILTTFFDSCGEEIKTFSLNPTSNKYILPGTVIGVDINLSNSGGSGTRLQEGSIEDTVTDNY